MPKASIDYSNTIIYKICCKDPTITDVYVGHTTNFISRKHQHKQSCKNTNNLCQPKIYKIINENGGWDNWDMIEIAVYNCKDATEARIKENEHYEQLKATLNSVPPFIDKSKFYCNICDIQLNNESSYHSHLESSKHINYQNYINTDEDSDSLYNCDICKYVTFRKKDFNKHLKSIKHNKVEIPENTLEIKKSGYNCLICNNVYQYSSGLSKHKKKCLLNEQKKKEEEIIINNNNNIENIELSELIKQNNEFKDIIIKQNAQLLEKNNIIINLLKKLKVE